MAIDYEEFSITIEKQVDGSCIGHVRRKDGKAFTAARHMLNHMWSTMNCADEETALAEAKTIADAGSVHG